MKSAAFALDRHVYELFQSGELDSFTPRSLRDAYAQLCNVPHQQASDLRRYVFRQILRLQKIGWVARDPEKRGRDQIYHLRNLPPSVNLRLLEGGYPSVPAPAGKYSKPPSGKGIAMSSDRTVQHLQTMVKEARLDFLTSMGETERYRQLLDDLPHLLPKLEGDYIEARDRSSRLLGHLRAMEKTLKTLGIG